MKNLLDKKRIIVCFLAVLGMGFFLSFLMLCGLGTDPCSFMNKAISLRIGMLFGTWQLIINAVLLIIVVLWDRSNLGFGTLFNMILVGYYVDFFDWVWGKVIPAHFFSDNTSKWGIFIVALLCFIISAAVYINCDMGVAPYDALPKIITEKVSNRFSKFPKMLVRMAWDFSAILVGVIAGGIPVVGIILMAIFLGPAISLVGKLFFRRNQCVS
jgi:Predicted membrane protein